MEAARQHDDDPHVAHGRPRSAGVAPQLSAGSDSPSGNGKRLGQPVPSRLSPTMKEHPKPMRFGLVSESPVSSPTTAKFVPLDPLNDDIVLDLIDEDGDQGKIDDEPHAEDNSPGQPKIARDSCSSKALVEGESPDLKQQARYRFEGDRRQAGQVRWCTRRRCMLSAAVWCLFLGATVACWIAFFPDFLSFGNRAELLSGPVPVVTHEGEDTAESDYFLTIHKHAGASARSALLQAFHGRNISFKDLPVIDGLLVRLDDSEVKWLTQEPPPLEAVQFLERDIRVGGIEPLQNTTQHVVGNTGSSGSDPRRTESMMNDPHMAYLWGSVEDVFRHTEWSQDELDGSTNDVYAPEFHGQGVDIYIMDTGVRCSHREFGSRCANSHFEVDGGTVNSPRDVQGHGTAMAGAALGKKFGSAQNANLISVQVLTEDGSGTSSGIVEGLNWIAQRTCDKCVISMSLSSGKSMAINNAVKNMIQNGYPTIVAAGNQGGDACDRSPASTEEAITVGALGRYGDQSSFSNKGSCVDIYAPGEYIRGASWRDWWGYGSDTAMMEVSGTSPATAVTAGVAAMYLEAGVPKADLKAAMLAGARQWGSSRFVSSNVPAQYAAHTGRTPPAGLGRTDGEVSSRRRYMAWTRSVTSGQMDGQPGDTLICEVHGDCTDWGTCDVDLVAKGRYDTRRRRWWGGETWHALAYAQGGGADEKLEVRIGEAGKTACEAYSSFGWAKVNVYAGLRRPR